MSQASKELVAAFVAHCEEFAKQPKAPEPKLSPCMNAVTHGLSGSWLVLAHEDPAAFDQLLRDLRTDHRARTSIEDLCLEQIAQATWKLRRIGAIEKALWDIDLGIASAETSPVHKMAASFFRKKDDITEALDKLNRYETSARRSFHQAEQSFRRHQKYAHEALQRDMAEAFKVSDVEALKVGFEAGARAMQLKARLRMPKPAAAPTPEDAPKPNETNDTGKTNSAATP